MSKREKSIGATTQEFLGEVAAEAKRISWPTWRELFESTVVVLVSVLILAVFIGISDLIVVKIVNFIVS